MDVQTINSNAEIKHEIGNPNRIKTVGSTPIPDAGNNSHIIKLARWAVNEYGKEQGLPMSFGKVIEASMQITPDEIKYYIILYAANTDLGLMTKYEAIVFEEVGGLKLIEFKPLAL